jgi:VIT1/CCC1 family predicted Fe2+/Mn2+ transporter
MATLERHRFDRIGWLRAAVLGANDGIVSTASLVVGVARQGPGAALVPVSPGWWLARCRWWRVFR